MINEYIDLVWQDKNILDNPEKIYENKGKWRDYFQNQNEIYLEIGTWLGHFFSIEASENLDKNFIGMEIKFKRLYKTAQKSRDNWVKNFVLLKDFGQNIDKIFQSWEVSRTYIFFPDPWDKKERQKKHKLLQAEFLENLFNITKSWGKVCFKTDHKWYFDEVLEIVREQKLFTIESISYDYERETDLFDKQKQTVFESMFRWQKLKINYAEFVK